MSRFFAACFASLMITLATAYVASMKTGEKHADPPAQSREGREQRVAYKSVDAGGRARCSVVYDPDAGLEMQVRALGIRQARMAFDGSIYWFWARPFDSGRYYFCHPDDASSVPAAPFLRPSFVRWMLNRECDLSADSFQDGEYTVDLEFRDGAITRQRYTRDGELEAEVIVTELQRPHGKALPRRARVFVRDYDAAVDVDMGPAAVGSDMLPDTNPPEGMKGEKLRSEN